ncbi:hypothetical protein D041_0754A, partial [Vibrio parahaemolyticus EKP-008]
MAWSIGPS